MAFRRKRMMSVNMMYGVDGKLRTVQFEGDAAKVARKNVKAFNKELARFEKEFTTYSSLDIEADKIYVANSRYIYGKLNIAEQYVDYIPVEDMADSLGEDLTVIAGNEKASKVVPSFGAKVAGVFQPFFERQAEKHPRLRVLSDAVTKAANDGRMPLTAESAAMMRIAFDRKYYNDCRRPGVDKEWLYMQYTTAIDNLGKMAQRDGVEPTALSDAFSRKLVSQMQLDESLVDVYTGMADGRVRLADSKPVINDKGEVVKIGGKTLYQKAVGFVSAEKDEQGRNIPIDAWTLSPREPQSIDDILSDYQAKLETFARNCDTEADFKRMLASDSYRKLEHNAKVFAANDCPDDAAKFKYEFTRSNIQACKNWAISHGEKEPYARLVVPEPWEDKIRGNEFAEQYSMDDYDDQTEIHDSAVDDIIELTDGDIAISMAEEYETDVSIMIDTQGFDARLAKLEAENKALREQLALMQQQVAEPVAKHDDIIQGVSVKHEEQAETITEESYADVKTVVEESEAVEDELVEVAVTSDMFGAETDVDDKLVAKSDITTSTSKNGVIRNIADAAFVVASLNQRYGSPNKTILSLDGGQRTHRDIAAAIRQMEADSAKVVVTTESLAEYVAPDEKPDMTAVVRDVLSTDAFYVDSDGSTHYFDSNTVDEDTIVNVTEYLKQIESVDVGFSQLLKPETNTIQADSKKSAEKNESDLNARFDAVMAQCAQFDDTDNMCDFGMVI